MSAYDPESVIGLPSGEIAIMGPEAAINAVYARKLAEIDDPEERERVEQELREDIDVHRMASEVVIDELVPPSDLREELETRFVFYESVEKDLPDKKHGTVLCSTSERSQHTPPRLSMTGRYYEEFEVGETIEHEKRRTISERDNQQFCDMTMNQQPLRREPLVR